MPRVRRGVIDYDRRHGYRGPEAYVSLPDDAGRARRGARARLPGRDGQRRPRSRRSSLEASPTEVKAVLADGEAVADHRRRPQVRRARRCATRRRRPPASGRARSSASPATTRGAGGSRRCRRSKRRSSRCGRTDGAILSLVGGFDFDRSKFNHVTQAQRQPGSAFKPFIYSAALEKGFTPATVVNDAPFFVPADQAGGEDWEPKNYDGKFDGPMRVRAALAQVQEPRHRPRAAGDRAAIRAGLHRAVRLRSEASPALPDDGARRGLGDAAADGRCLRGVRERRLSRHALPDRADRRRARQRAVRGRARRCRRRTPSGRSIRATRGS